MQVIALVGNKGGAGKTTLAINLASAFNELATTVLLDADPQGSTLQWFNIKINIYPQTSSHVLLITFYILLQNDRLAG